mmetsp:Transcript_16950/g.34318  ORF Transcript_16950/g.34318 Transcript_16950/m.34318 type:complete len:95 (-) Transcript_16950:384-668(-)
MRIQHHIHPHIHKPNRHRTQQEIIQFNTQSQPTQTTTQHSKKNTNLTHKYTIQQSNEHSQNTQTQNRNQRSNTEAPNIELSCPVVELMEKQAYG